MTVGYNRILDEGGEPSSWGSSRTAMLGKNSKPRVEQIRLITMTEVGYKIFMSILGDKMDRHLEENELGWENQTGFTKGGRVEDNLFILQHMVERAFRNREELVIVGVDFEKAYDSVRRDRLIEILRDYRVQGEIIDFISRVYTGDRTKIGIGGDKEIEIELESGIRQGCTASTVLFKMVTYKIIEGMNRQCEGVNIGGYLIRCLFFADDGLLVSKTIEETRKKIQVLEQVGGYYGLGIHKGKSKVVIFNRQEQPGSIEGIKVEKEFKYLGLVVENRRDLFKGQRDNMIRETNRMGKLAYSVMARACNRIGIGKTYWKNVVLPSTLYGGNIVVWREGEIGKLQVAENEVLRKMVGAPGYAALAGVRGEIGIGTMKARIVRGRLQYIRAILQGGRKLINKVWDEMELGRGKFMESTRKYCSWVGIEVEELRRISRNELKGLIAEVQDRIWKEELGRKVTLELYRTYKTEMEQEDSYDGRPDSTIWFRARTNCLRLGDRNRHLGGEVSCFMCREGTEDLEHFILDCMELEGIRTRLTRLQ